MVDFAVTELNGSNVIQENKRTNIVRLLYFLMKRKQLFGQLVVDTETCCWLN